MRAIRLFFFVLAVFSSSQFSIAQQTHAPASPAQRDPQALAVLQKAFAAMGCKRNCHDGCWLPD